MHQPSSTVYLNKENYYMEVFLDPFNKRVRIDDYRGNLSVLLNEFEDLAQENQAEKLIVKGRPEHIGHFIEAGYGLEAKISGYFRGTDAYFFTKYYSSERKKNDHWITEDGMVKSIVHLNKPKDISHPPAKFTLIKAEERHAEKLATLYGKVFKIYPTPLQQPEYIKKTMSEGTVYFIYMDDNEIISAASAEINDFYKNAELTDCATLPEYRQHGLMKFLLKRLERELLERGIYCSYSIARALSFGMNAVLHQLGYRYQGRLMNNCYIYDKLENMNVWVRNLAE